MYHKTYDTPLQGMPLWVYRFKKKKMSVYYRALRYIIQIGSVGVSIGNKNRSTYIQKTNRYIYSKSLNTYLLDDSG